MKPLSLRTRIAGIAFLLLALVMAAALSHTLAAYRRGASTLVAEIERSRLSTLGVFARDALLTRGFARIQPHLESLASGADVVTAMLVDEERRVVASSEPSRVGTSAPELVATEMTHWQRLEIGLPGQPAGELAVEFSTARQEALERSVREQATLVGVAGSLLCAALSVLAAHLLVRRLDRILRTARKVRDGDLSARIGLDDRDEVGQLGQAIDEMVERLAATETALRAHQSGLEALVQERTDELRAAQATLIENERLSTLGELTASVSHELRNPLGTIGASLHALRRETVGPSEVTERAFRRAERGIQRCVRIIDDLRDYSTAHDLEPSRFDLAGLIESNLEHPRWTEGVRVETELDAGLWLYADAALVDKALTHVLRNAVQAVDDYDSPKPRGVVRVLTRARGNRAVIEVSDDAGGISDEAIARVLAPLYSTRAFGTGLGLPIAQEIVECHGGTLSIDSRVGRGTTVTMDLPLADERLA